MKILCDFDGTAAKHDVGNLLFRTFAGDACFDIVQLWKNGEISSKECLQRECAIATVSRAELAKFCDSQELAPYFPEFVAFCDSRHIPIDIVSDGLDFYVERILANHGLNQTVDFYCNKLHFSEQSRIGVSFPFYDLGCGRCANCKGYHVMAAKSDGLEVMYIGDGLSDRCGAQAADIVVAKRGRDLEQYCEAEEIDHHKFDHFGDVLDVLKRHV
jgi:2,3-diketo-5-methylthio-1-phosphopentane phosphatase